MNELILFIIIPFIIAILIFVSLMLVQRQKYQKNIILLSKLDNKGIIEEQQGNKKKNDSLTLKLIQSGITYKEYMEARFVFVTLFKIKTEIITTTPIINIVPFASWV